MRIFLLVARQEKDLGIAFSLIQSCILYKEKHDLETRGKNYLGSIV